MTSHDEAVRRAAHPLVQDPPRSLTEQEQERWRMTRAMNEPRHWLFELTADEWFHLASEGQESEIAPCCGNIGALRDALRELLQFQSEDDVGWQRTLGSHILTLLEADGDGHGLQSPKDFPLLLHRVVDGIKAMGVKPRAVD